jgi:ElaB/YqjD/DUF883 family membrane-anchored ribosome-binding protein
MENDTEVIRQQMAETRTSLSEKVEAVEELVASAVKETTQAVNKTVENVTDAVEGTVNTVKETVAGTVNTVKETVAGTVNTVTDSVESVKNALDISGYVEKHPWLVMGGCVAVGYALGSMLGESQPHRAGSSTPARSAYEPPASPSTSEAWGATSAAPTSTGSAGGSLTSFIPDSWMPVIDKLKGLAIGTMSGVVGEMVMKAVPENIKNEVSQLLDDTTQRLGGTPVRHQ